MSVAGRACKAAGRDSCWSRWEKLQITLEIPFISSGYTIALGCQLNTRGVKAKGSCKSLRPNPRQCFFKRTKHISLNWLIVQTLAKFVAAYSKPGGQLTSLSARHPRAAAASMGWPLPHVAAFSWGCWLHLAAPNPAPLCPKTHCSSGPGRLSPHTLESPKCFILAMLIAGVIFWSKEWAPGLCHQQGLSRGMPPRWL